jgi:DNA-binding transcriptional LysR family regulator
MTLQQLKYAVGVAQSGSFSEAAKRLYVSQPSLSSAIKELEEEMGVEIFSRNARGVSVTVEGAEFLGYARQVLEQAELLDMRYRGSKPVKRVFSVSTQHYAFAVNAFVGMVREYGESEYEFTIRETRTFEILDDVKNLRSEIGILYINPFNEKILNKFFRDFGLEFTPLFTAKPHVFISSTHPLAKRKRVCLDDLDLYPCLSYEQGEHNSFYFSEEILSALSHRKNIVVSDRATLFNLLIGLEGYTISTGILPSDLNGNSIIAVPLDVSDEITVGCIKAKGIPLSQQGKRYLAHLAEYKPGSRRKRS